ncbi:MAG: hypothetical protein HQ595_04310, partial [Candidatus Omnitrophica bacterium]|nr:hypothetical protein [Candidatus Omnitrophota bacterium]
MAGKDIIAMSQKELSRIHIINKTINKVVTQVGASKLLKLTTRQIRRITKRVLKEGDKAIAHRSRGRPSPRAFHKDTKDKIIKLCRTKYEGFNPTFASEKLFEI